MTRETRIGLLVGLVFIVAFGVLLSELTGRSGPTPPPPAATAEHVENYLHTPTIEEASEANVGPLFAEAGSGRARTGGGAAIVETDVLRPDHGRASVIETISTEVKPPPSLLTAALAPLTRTAVLGGVPVGTVGGRSPPPGGTVAVTAPSAGTKIHKVQAGDRLMTMAAKYYGKGQEKQYKRILDANKKTLPDEKTPLIPGMEIVIPPAEGAAATAGGAGAVSAAGGYGTPPGAATAAGAAGGTPPAGSAIAGGARARFTEVGIDGLGDALGGRKPAGAGAAAAGGAGTAGTTVAVGTGAAGKLYTTRQGDTFSKIAREQLRDGSFKTVQKLIDLNRGKVSNPNRLPTGLEIQLPA